MNTKIARALSSLFQLSDEDRAFVFRVWNMNDAERESLVEALSPQKQAGKKASKKSSTKSPRAQSLSGAIQRTPKVRASDDNEDGNRCTYKLGEDARGRPVVCDRTLDNNVHHKKTDPDYHEFITTARADDYTGADTGKSPAPGVGARSLPKEAYTLSVPSSETQPEDVSNVHREASGGD